MDSRRSSRKKRFGRLSSASRESGSEGSGTPLSSAGQTPQETPQPTPPSSAGSSFSHSRYKLLEKPVLTSFGRRDLLAETPPTYLGANVTIRNAEITFSGLIRLDGRYEGKLICESTGDIIIGSQSFCKADIKGIDQILIDGIVVGDIVAEKVDIRMKAQVFGSIVCKSLFLDPTAILVGRVNVNPKDDLDSFEHMPPPSPPRSPERAGEERVSSPLSSRVTSPVLPTTPPQDEPEPSDDSEEEEKENGANEVKDNEEIEDKPKEDNDEAETKDESKGD